MDENDFSKNPLAVYPKFTPAKFNELKPKPHPLEGFRFAKGGRMQDPLMAINQKQELVIVEREVMKETDSDTAIIESVAVEEVAAKKPKKKYRNKPIWPEIARILASRHPTGMTTGNLAAELGENKKTISSAIGKAKHFDPDILSLVDGRWVLKKMPAGMESEQWEVSQAVGRIFTSSEPAMPEFDQAAEFIAAVREIARRVISTDERLALLLQMGAEFVEQVTAEK